MDETEKEGDVARIRAPLRSLETERIKLENKLDELQRRPAQVAFLDNSQVNVTRYPLSLSTLLSHMILSNASDGDPGSGQTADFQRATHQSLRFGRH
jgi:hypothetical protein